MESKRRIAFLKIKSRADFLKEINSVQEDNQKKFKGKYCRWISLESITINTIKKSNNLNLTIFSGIINKQSIPPPPNVFLIELEEKSLKLSLLLNHSDWEEDALGFIEIFSRIMGFDPKKINGFPDMHTYLWEV